MKKAWAFSINISKLFRVYSLKFGKYICPSSQTLPMQEIYFSSLSWHNQLKLEMWTLKSCCIEIFIIAWTYSFNFSYQMHLSWSSKYYFSDFKSFLHHTIYLACAVNLDCHPNVADSVRNALNNQFDITDLCLTFAHCWTIL